MTMDKASSFKKMEVPKGRFFFFLIVWPAGLEAGGGEESKRGVFKEHLVASSGQRPQCEPNGAKPTALPSC